MTDLKDRRKAAFEIFLTSPSLSYVFSLESLGSTLLPCHPLAFDLHHSMQEIVDLLGLSTPFLIPQWNHNGMIGSCCHQTYIRQFSLHKSKQMFGREKIGIYAWGEQNIYIEMPSNLCSHHFFKLLVSAFIRKKKSKIKIKVACFPTKAKCPGNSSVTAGKGEGRPWVVQCIVQSSLLVND